MKPKKNSPTYVSCLRYLSSYVNLAEQMVDFEKSCCYRGDGYDVNTGSVI